jgi:cytochrome c oxidase subunit 2
MMDVLRTLLYLPRGGSTVANDIDLLHAFVISVTMIMSTYVFGAAAWFTIRYASKRAGQLTTPLHATTGREAVLVCGVLGMFILWWVVGFRQYLALSEPPKDAEVVYVEAKQWMWKFSYADGHDTNDILTVPVGKPIRLVMTSRDVIHSFYVPGFRVKQDVIPGRYTSVWFQANEPGTFPIYCAEYCGVSHSLMRGEVVVLSRGDYAALRRGASVELVEIGRQVAIRRACVACHTLDGQRHVGPTWSRLYGSERTLKDGRHVIADEEYLTRSMMDPNVDVVAGYTAVMPTYQGTLTAAETGALLELIRSLRDGPIAPGVGLPALVVEAAPDGGAAP